MKKTIFTLVCFMCISFSGFAQFIINGNGNIGIGTNPNGSKATVDGNFNVNFSNSMWGGGVSIIHQVGSWFMDEVVDINPSVGQHPYIKHTIGKNTPFFGIYAWEGEYTNLNVWSYFNYSDERLKRNISSLSFDRNSFSKLQPVSYEISNAAMLKAKNAEEKNEEPIYTPQYGFIAQELEKIYPQLVVKDEETGYLKLKPLELIPILVAAIQDQQTQIDELKQLVNTPNSPVLKATTGEEETVLSITSALLYQNIPNPFNQSTEIKFYIPENAKSAQLCIYNLQGKQIKQIVIAERGEGSQVISGSELTAGMYLYALIVDSKEVDTKRMILTE